MMEVHFKAKTTQAQPPKDNIFEKYNYARQSDQQYNEKTKSLEFKIYDKFDNAGKVKDELRNLLARENIFDEWDVQGLFVMLNNGEIFNALEDERLLKVYDMPTLEEFLNKLFPSTAGVSGT
ncbi:hypothetical protein FGADI_7354 [Fusarium gaditjirri]|uniref:Uncharacterized protein n=1 Tax=Fusarium gaditjirri TaxID=282569 RepID=A0A8H4T5G2_9HYPO|nr:hypothetical protein FGADI_7354 [Fusarium gaditjirri]